MRNMTDWQVQLVPRMGAAEENRCSDFLMTIISEDVKDA